jgi:hypothetical protein
MSPLLGVVGVLTLFVGGTSNVHPAIGRIPARMRADMESGTGNQRRQRPKAISDPA